MPTFISSAAERGRGKNYEELFVRILKWAVILMSFYLSVNDILLLNTPSHSWHPPSSTVMPNPPPQLPRAKKTPRTIENYHYREAKLAFCWSKSRL